jgi:site-specific DNA-adenine methylase
VSVLFDILNMDLPFVELCAGSAAVAMRLCGQSPPVSYAGNKRGYADAILETFGLDKNVKRPIILVEPGRWGQTWDVLRVPEKRTDVCKRIVSLSDADARQTWVQAKDDMAHSNDSVTRCAAHLLVVAGTHGGFEKGGFKGKHKRRPNVDGFIPNRDSIAKRVKTLDIAQDDVSVCHQDAREIVPFKSYCYIDPPYKNTTGYENCLERNDVVDLAIKWDGAGAHVVVSEGEPIHELTKRGWQAKNITKQRTGQHRKNSVSKAEWLTFNFPCK